jgi:stearoyl-CoA desaturase (Delta-9 desaturase)
VGTVRAPIERFEPAACAGLLAMHASAFAALATGVSRAALAVAAMLGVARAFGLTAGYHRYFAHRAFRTSRAGQLLLACLGASAAQLGPLWWAGHHRRHHQHSDRAGDVHSPAQRSLAWAHLGWLLCRRYADADLTAVPDLARFPELRALDRWHFVPPAVLAAASYALGAWLEPAHGTSGAQMLVVGFVWSTIALYHVTFAVNSLGHRFGTRRFESGDESRNNAWLALVTLGDGWHNNHHRFPGSARHGLSWREPDPTWWALRGLAALGLVWDLRDPPDEAYAARARSVSRRAPARRAASARAISTTPTLAAHANPNRSPTRP